MDGALLYKSVFHNSFVLRDRKHLFVIDKIYIYIYIYIYIQYIHTHTHTHTRHCWDDRVPKKAYLFTPHSLILCNISFWCINLITSKIQLRFAFENLIVFLMFYFIHGGKISALAQSPFFSESGPNG